MPRSFAWLLLFCALGCLAPSYARTGLFDAGKDQIHANTQYRSISAESFETMAQKAIDGSGSMILDTYMASGIRTLCELPNIAFADDDGSASMASSSHPSVASFLTPLRDQCMRYVEGWWTYEFCAGRQLRQYHADPQGKVEKEYILGSALHKPSPSGGAAGTINTASMSGEEYLAHLESLKIDSEAGHPYYSEHYAHGTPCDVTQGTPREFEARWTCSPSAAGTAIRSVKEPASCRYILEVESPLICEHPSYRTSETPLYLMTCYFVDSDAISAAKDKKGNLSPKEQVALDRQWLENNVKSMKSHLAEGEEANAQGGVGGTERTETAQGIDANKLEVSVVPNSIPGLSTGATFVIRPVEGEEVPGEDYLRALQTSAILRETVKERAEQKISLAVLTPTAADDIETSASAAITEDANSDDFEIVTGDRLEQLLSQLSDADLLTLLATMDEAVAYSEQEKAAMLEEGLEFDENEKIVLEIDTTGHPLPWDHHINAQDSGSEDSKEEKERKPHAN